MLKAELAVRRAPPSPAVDSESHFLKDPFWVGGRRIVLVPASDAAAELPVLVIGSDHETVASGALLGRRRDDHSLIPRIHLLVVHNTLGDPSVTATGPVARVMPAAAPSARGAHVGSALSLALELPASRC